MACPLSKSNPQERSGNLHKVDDPDWIADLVVQVLRREIGGSHGSNVACRRLLEDRLVQSSRELLRACGDSTKCQPAVENVTECGMEAATGFVTLQSGFDSLGEWSITSIFRKVRRH